MTLREFPNSLKLLIMEMMKAIVIGSTGLVGKQIVKKLLNLNSIDEVQVFARRSLNLSDPKLREEIVDFDKISEWGHKIRGNILFSAVGTTLRAAGSKEAQFKIDYTYQLETAKAAARNGVECFVLISTINANPRSPFFYLRMKGQLEEAVKELPFQSINLLRPGPLTGPRERIRWGEVFSTSIIEIVKKFVKLNIEPIDSEKVADAAILSGLKQERGIQIINPKEILESRSQKLLKQY